MDRREVQGKRVTVIGAARSGLAVASLLRRVGAEVFLTENRPEKETSPTRLGRKLQKEGIAYEFGGHTERALEADFLAISPGVPSSVPIVRQATDRGMAVHAEVEIASWFCDAPMVAVTGSNGKTTTTSVLGHIFRTAGRTTFVGGNIGNAFSDFVLDARKDDVVVLEISSFQLDYVSTFRPRVSVLMNITPDHLDRYGHDFDAYARSKFRIFEQQRPGDAVVYNVDDDVIKERVAGIDNATGPRAIGFSQTQELETGAFLRYEQGKRRSPLIILRMNQQEEVVMQTNLLSSSLAGRHNLYNSLAAAMAARAMEVGAEHVRESLATFEGIPHRLEFVREVDRVRYVNDSKATNVNAVWYALESFPEQVVLIAGGRDKGNDYSMLVPLVEEKVRAVIAIGEGAPRLVEDLGGVVETVTAESLEEAVLLARERADPGDIVLLSPACASFDMFENYEHRGDVFKRIVMNL